MPASSTTDVLIVGAGLAGLVAAAELVDAGVVSAGGDDIAAESGDESWMQFRQSVRRLRG